MQCSYNGNVTLATYTSHSTHHFVLNVCAANDAVHCKL